MKLDFHNCVVHSRSGLSYISISEEQFQSVLKTVSRTSELPEESRNAGLKVSRLLVVNLAIPTNSIRLGISRNS